MFAAVEISLMVLGTARFLQAIYREAETNAWIDRPRRRSDLIAFMLMKLASSTTDGGSWSWDASRLRALETAQTLLSPLPDLAT